MESLLTLYSLAIQHQRKQHPRLHLPHKALLEAVASAWASMLRSSSLQLLRMGSGLTRTLKRIAETEMDKIETYYMVAWLARMLNIVW